MEVSAETHLSGSADGADLGADMGLVWGLSGPGFAEALGVPGLPDYRQALVPAGGAPCSGYPGSVAAGVEASGVPVEEVWGLVVGVLGPAEVLV